MRGVECYRHISHVDCIYVIVYFVIFQLAAVFLRRALQNFYSQRKHYLGNVNHEINRTCLSSSEGKQSISCDNGFIDQNCNNSSAAHLNGLISNDSPSPLISSSHILPHVPSHGHHGHISSSAQISDIDIWKRVNIFLSLIHAVIASYWCLSSFYEFPDMWFDMKDVCTRSAYLLMTFSTGYWLSDTVDMLINNRDRESLELLPHHITILICYPTGLLTRTYVGLALLCLLAEVNSVFLHSRQMMRLLRLPKSSLLYQTNSAINFITFLIFRMVMLVYLGYWEWVNVDRIPSRELKVGVFGFVVMLTMNSILFYRLIVSDWIHRKSSSDRHRRKVSDISSNILTAPVSRDLRHQFESGSFDTSSSKSSSSNGVLNDNTHHVKKDH